MFLTIVIYKKRHNVQKSKTYYIHGYTHTKQNVKMRNNEIGVRGVKLLS